MFEYHDYSMLVVTTFEDDVVTCCDLHGIGTCFGTVGSGVPFNGHRLWFKHFGLLNVPYCSDKCIRKYWPRSPKSGWRLTSASNECGASLRTATVLSRSPSTSYVRT